MTHQRPKHLNFLKMRFSLSAIVSILHRLSGIALFLFLPFLVLGFALSLNEAGFMQLQACFHSVCGRLIIWCVALAVIYHFLAGIRHLFIDASIGETRAGGQCLARLVIIVFVVLALLLGIALC